MKVDGIEYTDEDLSDCIVCFIDGKGHCLRKCGLTGLLIQHKLMIVKSTLEKLPNVRPM